MDYVPPVPYTVPEFIRIRSYWGLWTPGKPNPHNIYNIKYKDIKVIADKELSIPSVDFYGFNTNQEIYDIILENITWNGNKLNSETLPIAKNDFAKNITII